MTQLANCSRTPSGGVGVRRRRLTKAALAAALAGVPVAAVAAPAAAQDDNDPGDVLAVPTVALSKVYQPSDPDPAPGETITFTVTLANESSADAIGYAVEGPMPPEVVDVTWTCTATGAGSACGVADGSGDLVDTPDVGAGGTVVYVVIGTIAPDTEGEFTQAVTLVPGPGQACEPVAEVLEPEQYYTDPPAVEPMVCRVNNTVIPESLPVPPPEGEPAPREALPAPAPAAAPAPPAAPGLPVTGSAVVAYTLGGSAAALAGAALLWLTRRRTQP